MLKASKIGNDLETFLNEHPEIQIVRDYDGKIKRIHIPDDATIFSLIISNNSLCDLSYMYDGKFYHFSEKETR